MLRQIKSRMKECKLSLHSEKTKIINLRGFSQEQYPKGFDFLGFTIRLESFKFKERIKAIPGIFISQKSKTGIMEKFKAINIHKIRTSLEHIAQRINPMIRGIINYYYKFQQNDIWQVWNQLNVRLLKWVKWEKGLGKKRAICYLRIRYKENPTLFEHWRLVHP